MEETLEETPIYDEVLHIVYEKDENMGSGKKETSKKKQKYIDAFFQKKFLDAYFSSTKKK